MTKLATIVAAAAIALTISSASAHEHTGPRVKLSGPDAGIQLPDGRAVQFEYIPFVLTHAHDDRLVVFEDGSAALLDCDAGIIRSPRGTSHPIDCK